MAPHVWQGPTASQDWYRDVLADSQKHGVSEIFVKLGQPLHNDITGDSAYVVVPAAMTFKVQGQSIVQSGATFTVALRKVAGKWRIASWAWAKGIRACLSLKFLRRPSLSEARSTRSSRRARQL